VRSDAPEGDAIRVNGRPVAPGETITLADLDRIGVGPLELEFRTGPAEVEIETLVRSRTTASGSKSPPTEGRD